MVDADEAGAQIEGKPARVRPLAGSFLLSLTLHAVLVAGFARESFTTPGSSHLGHLFLRIEGAGNGGAQTGTPSLDGADATASMRESPAELKEAEPRAPRVDPARAALHPPVKQEPAKQPASAAAEKPSFLSERAPTAVAKASAFSEAPSLPGGGLGETQGQHDGADAKVASAQDSGAGQGGSSGGGLASGTARLTYEQQLAAWLQRYKLYPDVARRRGLEGTASLRVEIRRDGTVISAALQDRSNFDVLDRAALDMIRRAAPFPRMPNGLAGDRFDFIVPIHFRLDQSG